MERRRKRHAPFFIPSMIFRQIAQTQGWRSAMPYSGISARGFAPAPESGENAKTGRMSPNDSPAPGPSGSISLREAAAQKGLSGIMRRNIPALSGLIRSSLQLSGGPWQRPGTGLHRGANGSVPQCSILRAPERTRRARAKGAKRGRAGDALRNREAPALGRLSAPCRCLPREMRPGARHTARPVVKTG